MPVTVIQQCYGEIYEGYDLHNSRIIFHVAYAASVVQTKDTAEKEVPGMCVECTATSRQLSDGWNKLSIGQVLVLEQSKPPEDSLQRFSIKNLTETSKRR